MSQDTSPDADTQLTPPDQAATIMANPQVLEALARIVPAEHAKLFGAELADRMKEARATVDRRAAAAASAPAPDAGQSRLKLDREQSAEWFRCALFRLVGRPDVTPDSRLDADGLITQALTPTTGSAGGYLMPEDFVAEVEKKANEPAIVWPLLTKRPTKSRTVKKPEVTSYVTPNKGTAANVNSATTATAITATEPVFSQLEWNLEDFDARMPLKLDLIEESPINIYQELLDLCADGYAVYHENLPMVGRGHATYQEPLGLLDSTAGITEVAISATPSVANILNFAKNIPQRYRARATMFMGAETISAVIAALAENVRAPQFLIDHIPPMKESEHVTEGKILGGDFSRYVVYHIRLLQVITSIAAERKTQEIVVTETWTGQPTIVDAFRIGTAVTY